GYVGIEYVQQYPEVDPEIEIAFRVKFLLDPWSKNHLVDSNLWKSFGWHCFVEPEFFINLSEILENPHKYRTIVIPFEVTAIFNQLGPDGKSTFNSNAYYRRLKYENCVKLLVDTYP